MTKTEVKTAKKNICVKIALYEIAAKKAKFVTSQRLTKAKKKSKRNVYLQSE